MLAPVPPPVRATALLCLWCATSAALLPAAAARAEPGAEARPAAALPEVTLLVAGPEPGSSRLALALVEAPGAPVVLERAALPRADRGGLVHGLGSAALGDLVRAEAAYVAADFGACLAALGDGARVLALLAEGERLAAARVALWGLACDVGRGALAEAERRAAAFAALELDVPSDVTRIAPDAEAALSRALDAAANGARAALRVSSTPPGLGLDVDGRPSGCETPCELVLRPGSHVVSFHGDGVSPAHERAELGAAGGALERALDPAPPALARAQWSARYGAGGDLESAGSLRLLARALPADRLLVLSVLAGDGDHASVTGGYLVHGEVVARDARARLSQSALEDGARGVLRNLLVRGSTIAPPRPVWKSPWLWAATGAGAVIAGTVTALALWPAGQRTEVRFQ
jgi:PEGA domain